MATFTVYEYRDKEGTEPGTRTEATMGQAFQCAQSTRRVLIVPEVNAYIRLSDDGTAATNKDVNVQITPTSANWYEYAALVRGGTFISCVAQ